MTIVRPFGRSIARRDTPTHSWLRRSFGTIPSSKSIAVIPSSGKAVLNASEGKDIDFSKEKIVARRQKLVPGANSAILQSTTDVAKRQSYEIANPEPSGAGVVSFTDRFKAVLQYAKEIAAPEIRHRGVDQSKFRRSEAKALELETTQKLERKKSFIRFLRGGVKKLAELQSRYLDPPSKRWMEKKEEAEKLNEELAQIGMMTPGYTSFALSPVPQIDGLARIRIASFVIGSRAKDSARQTMEFSPSEWPPPPKNDMLLSNIGGIEPEKEDIFKDLGGRFTRVPRLLLRGLPYGIPARVVQSIFASFELADDPYPVHLLHTGGTQPSLYLSAPGGMYTGMAYVFFRTSNEARRAFRAFNLKRVIPGSSNFLVLEHFENPVNQESRGQRKNANFNNRAGLKRPRQNI